MAIRIEKKFQGRSGIREQQYFEKRFLSAYSSAFKGIRKTKRLLSETLSDDLS